jgi:hypothetical protein
VINMSLLKLWFIRNTVLVSYSICMQHGSSDLSGSQSALTCLCVCARAQLGLREFNNPCVLKKRSIVITNVTKRVHKRTHTFRIEVSKSWDDCVRLEKENDNTLWQDAVRNEMKNVRI